MQFNMLLIGKFFNERFYRVTRTFVPHIPPHQSFSVMVGRSRNAFCIVRPPGHHAGINGLLSDAESCGFCLFNNVAAGAMHALSDEKHRPRC